MSNKVNLCDICTKHYNTKYLAQCVKCSKDGQVFICDQCGRDHDHFSNEKNASPSKNNNLVHDNEELLGKFARITNMNLKQAKEICVLDEIKVVDIESRDGKIIVEYFNNSLVKGENCTLENIWSLNKKSQDKKTKQLDTSKSLLLWNSYINQVYNPKLSSLLSNDTTHNVRGQRFTEFRDRIFTDAMIPADSSDHGILFLYEVCLQNVVVHGRYEKPTVDYKGSNWTDHAYKYLGRNVPDPNQVRYIGKVKVPVGKTTPCWTDKNTNKITDNSNDWMEYNRYYTYNPVKSNIKFIVHFKKH